MWRVTEGRHVRRTISGGHGRRSSIGHRSGERRTRRSGTGSCSGGVRQQCFHTERLSDFADHPHPSDAAGSAATSTPSWHDEHRCQTYCRTVTLTGFEQSASWVSPWRPPESTYTAVDGYEFHVLGSEATVMACAATLPENPGRDSGCIFPRATICHRLVIAIVSVTRTGLVTGRPMQGSELPDPVAQRHLQHARRRRSGPRPL